MYNRAKAVIENCKFAKMSDISASKVQRYLAGRRRDGLSIRSGNFYLQAVKQFCRWLAADNRTVENPLAYLAGQNPKTDIRHARRALTVEESDRLMEHTIGGETHSGMTGKERAMLYALSVTTGLRASELASLTWQSFSLSDSTPSVTVLAAYSKHRRDDVQPLRIDIARQLKAWKAEQEADEKSKVFGGFNPNQAAKMLRKDLEAAEIAYQDGAGRVADFHSLRHTFISNLSKSGVSPKIAQSLARHSTIGLTMDTYTHIGLYDERNALESLPVLPSFAGKRNDEHKAAALKTGTSDLPIASEQGVYKPVYKRFAKTAFSGTDRLASTGNEQGEAGKPDATDKSLKAEMSGTESGHLSPIDAEKKRRRWDSNPRITVLQTVALVHLATPPHQSILI